MQWEAYRYHRVDRVGPNVGFDIRYEFVKKEGETVLGLGVCTDWCVSS
jgi:hypothetical protein